MANTNAQAEFIRHDKLCHVRLITVDILYRNMHEHSDFEMNYIMNGSAKIIYKNEVFTVQKGDFFIINPYEPHELRSDASGPVRILSLLLSKRFCEDYYPDFHSLLFSDAALRPALSPADYEKLRLEMFALCRAYWSEKVGYQLFCVARLCDLFSHMMSCVPYQLLDDQESAHKKARYARSRRLREYVEMHFREKLSLDELAQREGLSRTYISHLFREDLQISFQEYLNRVRMEYAIYLMQNSSKNVTEICIESGFSDNKYLNQMLQKEFGCNAKGFRRIYCGKYPEAALTGNAISSQNLLTDEESLAAILEAEDAVSADTAAEQTEYSSST